MERLKYCYNCQYWLDVDGDLDKPGNVGLCHRNSPLPIVVKGDLNTVGPAQYITIFPPTFKGSRCKDHEFEEDDSDEHEE